MSNYSKPTTVTLQSDKGAPTQPQAVVEGHSKKKRAEQYNGIRIMNKRQLQQH